MSQYQIKFLYRWNIFSGFMEKNRIEVPALRKKYSKKYKVTHNNE